MRNALRASSAESFLMLFAVWGLGLAGMPADLDEPVLTAAVQHVLPDEASAVPAVTPTH